MDVQGESIAAVRFSVSFSQLSSFIRSNGSGIQPPHAVARDTYTQQSNLSVSMREQILAALTHETACSLDTPPNSTSTFFFKNITLRTILASATQAASFFLRSPAHSDRNNLSARRHCRFCRKHLLSLILSSGTDTFRKAAPPPQSPDRL